MQCYQLINTGFLSSSGFEHEVSTWQQQYGKYEFVKWGHYI